MFALLHEHHDFLTDILLSELQKLYKHKMRDKNVHNQKAIAIKIKWKKLIGGNKVIYIEKTWKNTSLMQCSYLRTVMYHLNSHAC